MAWIESHTVLRNHRKVLLLSRALRLNTAQTIGHLHLLWHAALEQQENGDLSKWSDDLIAELAGYTGDAPQFVRLLQEFGWLGYKNDLTKKIIIGTEKIIHDWWDYAGRYIQGKYAKYPDKWKEIKHLYSNLQVTCRLSATPNQPTNLPNQPKDICTEVPQAAPAVLPPTVSKTVLVFPCVGKGTREWILTEEKLVEYKQSFPGVEVLRELKKARQWCIDNPIRRKTANGMPAFLTRWLGRIQNTLSQANAQHTQTTEAEQRILVEYLNTKSIPAPNRKLYIEQNLVKLLPAARNILLYFAGNCNQAIAALRKSAAYLENVGIKNWNLATCYNTILEGKER